MKKLSFSIPHSSSSKKRPRDLDGTDAKKTEQDSRNYVTEFNADEAPAAMPEVAVIPPKEDTWHDRRLKKMKNLDLPISARPGGLQFETEPIPAAEPEVAYGLLLRDRTAPEDAVLRQPKLDTASLPDDVGVGEFEGVSIEALARGYLAGYGWKSGQGIGRNAKEDTKVVDYARRSDRSGVGFTSFELPVSVDKRRNSNGSEGKKRVKDGILGKEVRIVGGREAGMKGRVVERVEDRKLSVRLSKSDEIACVCVADVAEIGSREEERFLRRLKEERIIAAEERKVKQPIRSPPSASWLASGIRVKIVSKEVRGGRLYLKKGRVVDVVGPGICDVSMEEGRELLQGVSQDVLETVVPQRGGQVLVLLGPRRGVYGCLVERDSTRERGVVRDADSHELVDVRFEQIAEFVGDPSELGY